MKGQLIRLPSARIANGSLVPAAIKQFVFGISPPAKRLVTRCDMMKQFFAPSSTDKEIRYFRQVGIARPIFGTWTRRRRRVKSCRSPAKSAQLSSHQMRSACSLPHAMVKREYGRLAGIISLVQLFDAATGSLWQRSILRARNLRPPAQMESFGFGMPRQAGVSVKPNR